MTAKWIDDLVAAGWTVSEAAYDFPDGSRAKAFLVERGNKRIVTRADMTVSGSEIGGFGIGFRVELPIIEVRDERGIWNVREEE